MLKKKVTFLQEPIGKKCRLNVLFLNDSFNFNIYISPNQMHSDGKILMEIPPLLQLSPFNDDKNCA